MQHYISNKTPLYNSNGNIYGLCGISTDVTEIKNQSTLIEDLYDNAPCGYYSIDAEGKFVNVNKTILQWLGYQEEELIGTPFTDLLTNECAVQFEQLFIDLKTKGYLKDTEFTCFRKNKSHINILVNSSAVYNAEKEFKYTRSTISDITERKKLETKLNKADAELASIEWFKLSGKATADAMWDWDILSGRLAWGEGFETLFGYKSNEVKQNFDSWVKHIHPDDKERVVEYIFAAVNSEDKTHWSDEFRYIRAYNTYASVLDKGLILRDQNNKAYRMVGAMQDITENKKNIEDLEQFSFITSHNFTGPLSNQLGILNLVCKSTLDDYNKNLFEMIKSQQRNLKKQWSILPR